MAANARGRGLPILPVVMSGSRNAVRGDRLADSPVPGGGLAPAACAWCGEPFGDGATLLKGRTRCPHCGVATTAPWPTEAELDSAYSGWYRPAGGRFGGFGDRLLRRSRGLLAGRLDSIAPPGRVLDVGSGDGALLDALRALGREGLGLERSSMRPDVLEGDISSVAGPFAAVVFWHSLEHLPEPAVALAHAADRLCPGGVLVAALPNAESLQARAFGDRWFALDLPRHLVHVPAYALVERLQELGLEVERTSHLRGGQVLFGWLHGLVGRVSSELDLYDAIRSPGARQRAGGRVRRVAALGAAVLLVPLAAALTAAEVALRRGGTVYVEARRA